MANAFRLPFWISGHNDDDEVGANRSDTGIYFHT